MTAGRGAGLEEASRTGASSHNDLVISAGAFHHQRGAEMATAAGIVGALAHTTGLRPPSTLSAVPVT